MTARDVIRRLRAHGAIEVRSHGSHRRFVSACGKCKTTVPDHRGEDIKTGTLHAIEADMEPCFGKGWLTK